MVLIAMWWTPTLDSQRGVPLRIPWSGGRVLESVGNEVSGLWSRTMCARTLPAVRDARWQLPYGAWKPLAHKLLEVQVDNQLCRPSSQSATASNFAVLRTALRAMSGPDPRAYPRARFQGSLDP